MLKAQLLLLALMSAGIGCSPSFDPPSEVKSVRVLATRADKPYGAPGDTVKLDILAFDGRSSKPEAMDVFWFTTPCINPLNDAYYNCFPGFAKTFKPGIDLTPRLDMGTSFSFDLPADVITTHAAPQSGDAYGVAVVFSMACAGHVQYMAPVSGGAPDALPFGCFDDHQTQLDANDFVFSYSLVYSFSEETNANPVITRLTQGGTPVDPDLGVTVEHCTQGKIDDCPTTPLDTVVLEANQELTPANRDASGDPLKEEIWVDYYVTAGKPKNETVILYDTHGGRTPNTGDDFHAPQTAGEYLLWAVVHDNRGGADWLEVPLHAN